MLKPLQLLGACLICAMISYSQKTDTLFIFYKTDKYQISNEDKIRLDNFLLQGWDRLSISGYTDYKDDEEYNIDLSKRRSGEVYKYCVAKNIPSTALSSQFFGETRPLGDNETEEGRALNRRTTIIGYQFIRVANIKPKEDPMKPVTRTLDNGFIITYRPGAIPFYMSENFEAGWGMDFQLITNTRQMRENSLFNNTTNGEILSSVLIFRGDETKPCKLDSPVLVRVPINVETKCPLSKIKFFNAVATKGMMIWQEQSKAVYPEVIDGKQYISVWLENLCQTFNFDIKVDPDCYDLDSTQIYYVNADIKNLSAELIGLNSVYLPRSIDDRTQSIIYEKARLYNAPISFSLYNGKRRIKTFRNRSVTSLPYDSVNNRYLMSTASYKFNFPGIEVFDLVVKVNKDKYRVYPDGYDCEVICLNQRQENILVDFSTIDKKGRYTLYKDQAISSFPVDAKGYRVIDKDHLKLLREKGAVAEVSHTAPVME